MNRYLFSITILLTLGLYGCNNPLVVNNQPSILIKTDKASYNLKDDDSVKVTITNNSSETIFYSTCFEKTIEVLQDDIVTETFGTPVCYCICPAVLKPGESIPEQISSLSIETIKSRAEKLLSDGSLSYRIRYSLYFDRAFGDEPVPLTYSRTNTFRISEN